MCGIAGVIRNSASDRSGALIRAMTDSLSHRGPDGTGTWSEDQVSLGHSRLAIIDQSPSGAQPMHSPGGRYVLVFNGEVYNYEELRSELKSNGLKFDGRSDTEVVLRSLETWGPSALRRFNGMFALAFWDRRDQELLLARDRYGIKPLYFRAADSSFVFASEQRSILQDKSFRNEFNEEVLVEYLTFQNLFTDRTFSRGIRLLPAGTYAVVSPRTTSQVAPITYWDFEFREPDQPRSHQEYREQGRALVDQAVKRHLIGDAEVGVYLSGGIDSSLLTAVASRQVGAIKSFTCGFDLTSVSGMELAYDERNQAEFISGRFGTEHYQVVLKSGDMERALDAVVDALEEPRVGQSYPNYFAARLASRFVKVVLGGTGGDELFAGYPWRYYVPEPGTAVDDYVDAYFLRWQRLMSEAEMKALLSPIWNKVHHESPREIFRSVLLRQESSFSTRADFINQALYLEAKTFLHSLFIVEDKLSMAHSLEGRFPFMDNDLVDFALTCPVKEKIGGWWVSGAVDENDAEAKWKASATASNVGKLILRNFVGDLLGGRVSQAPKQGFSSPDASWFRGASIDYVRRKIGHGAAPLWDFLDFDQGSKMLDDHLSGRSNRRLLIWSFLSLNRILERS